MAGVLLQGMYVQTPHYIRMSIKSDENNTVMKTVIKEVKGHVQCSRH